MPFLPAWLRIRVGHTVAFKVDSSHEPHTFTFGPHAHTGAIERTLVEPQPRAGRPTAVIINPLGADPGDPLGSPLIHTHRRQPRQRLREQRPARHQPAHPRPSEVAVRITFTKLGTYYFECVIHPNIDNTITVTR